MNINFYLDKKIINKNVNEAVNDYLKRCRRFTKVNLFYKLDFDVILKCTSYNINVTNLGEEMDSVSFSSLISKCSMKQFKNLNIVFDVDKDIVKHDICFLNVDITMIGILYVMVIEQVYRAYKIINNEPYHK